MTEKYNMLYFVDENFLKGENINDTDKRTGI